MVPQQKVLRGRGTPTNGRGPLSRPMIWECKDLKEVMEGSMQEWEVHRSSQHGDKVGACPLRNPRAQAGACSHGLHHFKEG